jgi:hypothetical protein
VTAITDRVQACSKENFPGLGVFQPAKLRLTAINDVRRRPPLTFHIRIVLNSPIAVFRGQGLWNCRREVEKNVRNGRWLLARTGKLCYHIEL